MSDRVIDVVVAGHICLDLIPDFSLQTSSTDQLFQPGKLINVGPALRTLGGAVSNTGLALHHLGLNTRLMGKIGSDLFGRAILSILHQHAPSLAEDMLQDLNAHTSYSIVISPPGRDRVFFHHPGANDTFHASDVPLEKLGGARLFHFGYPPLMQAIYQDGGESFALLLQRLQANHYLTSLDMALPDPASEAGRANWRAWLKRVLPHVDLFLPSVEEIAFMLHGPHHSQPLDGALLSELAAELLELGASVVALKAGNHGLYIRTTSNHAKLARLQPSLQDNLESWLEREIYSSCYSVTVAGTTGAGDCTIAGFLAGFLHGLTLEETLTSAVAVGACSVECPDATSGIPPWSTLQQRIQAGWQKNPLTLSLEGWQPDPLSLFWLGPHDVISVDPTL